MKTFLTKHKVLMIALCGVLCLGVLSGLVLGGVIRFSKEGKTFATVAEAKEEQNEPAAAVDDESAEELINPVPTPSPAPAETKLSVDMIKDITEEVQQRRRTVIPVRTGIWQSDNTCLWTAEDATEEQKAAAVSAAEQLTEILFGQTYEALTGYEADTAFVTLFTDPTGDRESFFRILDRGRTYFLAVRASDCQLICADLLTYPDGALSDREKDNIAIAEKLGYHIKHYRQDMGMTNELIYQYKTDTETCLAFSYIGNKLWQVSVFPNSDAMLEWEYFLADIQWDYSTPAYPENFVEAEPPQTSEQDLVLNEQKIFASLARTYKNLSGEQLPTHNLKATFYRDESGAREDCWKITGEGFHIVISAYSGNVISFEGTIPCKDLLPIPYEQMGGEEYEAATKVIAENLVFSFGSFVGDTEKKTAKEIDVNAVYDGNYCTMDIVLNDGTWYECYYAGGVLKEIWYYADEHMFMEMPRGWVANGVYVHPYTGKLYIPEYRDWDGDLHVKPRPEN